MINESRCWRREDVCGIGRWCVAVWCALSARSDTCSHMTGTLHNHRWYTSLRYNKNVCSRHTSSCFLFSSPTPSFATVGRVPHLVNTYVLSCESVSCCVAVLVTLTCSEVKNVRR